MSRWEWCTTKTSQWRWGVTVIVASPISPSPSLSRRVKSVGCDTSGTSRVTSAPSALSTPASSCSMRAGTRPVTETLTAWRPSCVINGSTEALASRPLTEITGVEVSSRSACRMPS
ncbi:hypothetical protein ACFQGX_14150 [Nonomuraea dietziae]|uniref:hypothetical protein n=1 Tax=Nonomuraea dietziae TaxID=65515 RepID=UPI00360E3EE8